MQFNKKYTLKSDGYHQVEHKKDLIVLHFTAGHSAENAAQWFASRADRVSTPYVIDNDGTIFELYDPKYWSFHLGLKGTHDHDRRSIGIEIANLGPLKLKQGVLHSWPRDYSQIFCKLEQSERYVKSSYRGFDYYAAYTPAQFNSIAQLVKHLSDRFGIPYAIPNVDLREQFDVEYFSTYKGIASHQNFRKDKFDVGPAFDWSIFQQAQIVVPQYPDIKIQPEIKGVSKWQTILESVKKVFNRSKSQKDS